MIFHSSLLRSFGLLALAHIGLSQSDNITFVHPPPAGPHDQYGNDLVFDIGSTLNIQWNQTNSSSLSLVMYQNRPNDQFEYVFQGVTGLTSYLWTVATNKNFTQNPVFFFEFFIEGQTSPTAVSHSFNLTQAATTTTPSSATQTTMTTSTKTHTNTQTTSSTAPTNSAAAADSSSSGLSTGAKAGIGVGIPIAVILGAAAAFFLYRRARRSPNPVPQAGTTPSSYTNYKPPTEPNHPPKDPVEAPTTETPVVEAPPSAAPVELPAVYR